MSMNAIRQLNNGGLKLKSNFSAKSVAANITANRGAAASMVKGGYSTFGTNALFTPARRMGGAPRYMNASQLSRAMNGQNMRFVSGGGIPSYSGVSYSQKYNIGTSSDYNNGMGLGMALNLAMQLAGGLKELGVFGSKEAQTPKGTGSILDESMNALNTATTVSGNFTSSLSGAKSFNEINKIENDLTQKKATMNEDYKKIGTEAKKGADEILQGEDVKAGLEDAQVNIDTSALELSELQSDNLEESIKTIDSDINKVGQFKTTTLPQAKSQISQKSGQVSQELTVKQDQLTRSKADLETLKSTNKDGCNDAQIQKLEQEIQKLENEEIPKLKKEKEQLNAAEKAIDDITTQCGDTINSLKSKKTEITDMKKAEDNMKDKKYDLAKSQDEELGKCMKELEKLNKEIDQLFKSDKNPDKYDKQDEQRMNKLNNLIAKRGNLYSTLGKLTSSLSGAGTREFENSKGQKYTIKNLDKATEMSSNQPADSSVSNNFTVNNGNETKEQREPVGQGAGSDRTINGGAINGVKNTIGKFKDLSTVSDQYLDNALIGAISLGDKEQVAQIQAEIERRAGFDST